MKFDSGKRWILSWYYKTSNGHNFDTSATPHHLPDTSVLWSPTVSFFVSNGHSSSTDQSYGKITRPANTLSSLGVTASNSSYHNWVRDYMVLDFTNSTDIVASGTGDANTTATAFLGNVSGKTLIADQINQGFLEISVKVDDDGSEGPTFNTGLDRYDEIYIDGIQLEEVGAGVTAPSGYDVWPPGEQDSVFKFEFDETATANTKLVVSGPELHLSHTNNILYDSEALYKISARVNVSSIGTGNLSVGVIGIEHKEGKGSYVILGEDYSSFSSNVYNYEAPIAWANTTLSTGGWVTVNAYFQGTRTKNYVSTAYRSFESNNYTFGDVPMSNGLGKNETSTPPYPIFLRGDTTNGYANAIVDTTLGYSDTSSLQLHIPDTNARFVSFANSLAISGTDEYVGSAWGDAAGADWVIKIPKAKRWIFSYYARSNSAAGFPTSTGLKTQLYLRNSDNPEANVALISGVSPIITVADTWQRFSGILNFTESSTLNASDHSQWSAVTDTYANSLITTFTSAHALKGSDINQIILNVGPNASGLVAADSGNTIWYDSFMLEEQANTLITTPSTYSLGDWQGPGDGTFFDYSSPIQLESDTTHIRPFITVSQGHGYGGYNETEIDYIKIESTSNATAVVGITGNYVGLGKQKDQTSILSGKQKIQDSRYYQVFSYVIKSGLSVDRYKKVIKDLVHPAGMELFGKVFIESEMDSVYPHSVGDLSQDIDPDTLRRPGAFGPGVSAEMFPSNPILLSLGPEGTAGGFVLLVREFFFGPITVQEVSSLLLSGDNTSVIWDFNNGDVEAGA